MNNDEMLIVIKDMFEKSMEKMEQKFDQKIEEVKTHTGVLVEKLENDVKAVAEGHDILRQEIGGVRNEVGSLKKEVSGLKNEVKNLSNKVEFMDKRIDALDKNMNIVKDYVIGVDAKLNEHEIILKRVK